jgi:thioredoxin-dependent peroxiredoxin
MSMTRLPLVLTALMCAIVGATTPGLCPAAEKNAPADAPTTRPTTPKVGDRAADHTLSDVDGKLVRLSDELKAGPVVVIVLRGWPGYQCPFCTVQFGDLLAHADDFSAAHARVLVVYPGPAKGLREHAAEFRKDRELPEHFRLLVDPDYAFATAHGLRWDAPGETVCPATFVLDREGVIRFAQVSHEHGGRTKAREIVKALAALPQSREHEPSGAPGGR